jgi:AcrR family transcriptional regulator
MSHTGESGPGADRTATHGAAAGTAGAKARQADATRRALIDAARGLFAERGYGGVSTEEIVEAAAVTRGALYHHFRDKRELFRAVFEQIEQESIERIAGVAAGERDPWRRQIAAVRAFLDLCQEPDVQRISLMDAPSVLGWQEWRELEARYGLGLVRAGLALLMDEGVIERQPVEHLAHIVLGALMEAGLVIAGADDPDAAREEVAASVERLLNGLRRSP